MKDGKQAAAEVDELASVEQHAVFRERMWSHSALIASGSIVVLSIFRILGVSHYNLTSAMAVLGSSSPATIALGTAMLALPTVVTLITLQIGLAAFVNNDNITKIRIWSVYGCILIALSVTLPWYMPVLALTPVVVATGFAAFYFIRHRMNLSSGTPKPKDWADGPLPKDSELRSCRAQYMKAKNEPILSEGGVVDLDRVTARRNKLAEIIRKGNERVDTIERTRTRGREGLTWIAIGILAGPLMNYIYTNDQPWVAPEIIKVYGQDQFVGYMLDQSSDWYQILRESDRSMFLVNATDVTGREPCAMRKSIDRVPTIMNLLGATKKRPHYRDCPGQN